MKGNLSGCFFLNTVYKLTPLKSTFNGIQYCHSFIISRRWLPNLRNPKRIRGYSRSSHPMSSILVSIESTCDFLFCNFRRISYSFRDSSQNMASNRHTAYCTWQGTTVCLPTSVPSAVSCTYYNIDAFIFKIARFSHPTIVWRRIAFQYTIRYDRRV